MRKGCVWVWFTVRKGCDWVRFTVRKGCVWVWFTVRKGCTYVWVWFTMNMGGGGLGVVHHEHGGVFGCGSL